jgi:transposase
VRLTESQWGLVEALLAEPRRSDKRGRPRCDSRGVLEGVLWVLQTGAAWKDLPRRFPSHQTCHRRYRQWRQDGTLERVLVALAEDLRRRGGIALAEDSVDELISRANSGAHSDAASASRRGPRPWQQRTAVVFLSPLGKAPSGDGAPGKRRSR